MKRLKRLAWSLVGIVVVAAAAWWWLVGSLPMVTAVAPVRVSISAVAVGLMAVRPVAVRIVAVRKHPVGAESAKRPGDDTLTDWVSSSPRRAKRTPARKGGDCLDPPQCRRVTGVTLAFVFSQAA